MADKNFGVKGINFISDPGTPTISIASSTITYAGSLNLNADTVAISTDVSIGGSVVSNIIVSNSYSVGIGTNILTEKLNISGNANISGVVSATSFVGSGVSLTGLLTNQSSGINTEVYHYLLVTPQTSGTISSISPSYNYIIFNPSAKYLGIGTDTPVAGLDVNGTGRFAGSVTAPTFQGTATTATNLADAANITTGIVSTARLSGTYNISVTGSIAGVVTTASGLTETASVNTTGIITATGGFVGSLTGTATGLTTTASVNTTGIITATGGFVGSLAGIASTATQLQTSRFFSISGDVSTGSSVSFNGTQNVGLAVTLALSGVTSATYGSSTSIPSISVNDKGIITGVTTSGITVGNGTLDLKTSGTGLTGIATFTANEATGTAVTFTVTSNATHLNTASTIVARDASGNFRAGIITATTFSGTATTATGLTTTASVNTTGIITANTFSTGISTENIGFTTGIISGPNTIFINPHQIGVSTGIVRILGNLIVDGTTVTTAQATIQTSADKIGIAISETNNIVLNDAGITIGSTSIQKTFLWNYGSESLQSSENLNVALGKVYQINDNAVLSSTTLANSVTTAAGLTTVGTLHQLVVSSNTSTNAVRITQTGSGNALIVEDEANPDGTAFIVSSDGSIGIGTTIPAYKLTITNNAIPTLGLTHAIADFTGSVDGYTQLNIRNSLAGASASADLIATADAGSDTTNYIDLGINNSAFSSGSWTVNGALDGYLYTSDGSLSIGIATNNTAKYLSFFAGGLLAANEQVRINQTGVGIGTTNPSVKLDVIGNTKVKGDFTVSNGELYITRTDGVSGDIFANGGTDGKFGIYNTTNNGSIELITKNSLGIYNNILKVTSEIATVNGNLGIGTTNPTSKLHVAGDVRITGVSTLGVTSTTNLTTQQLNVSGISTLGVTTATNLTTQQLNVSGISTLGVTTATNLTTQQLNVSGITTTQTLNVGTGGTVITTTAGGYVGIGTTNPTSKLFITNNNNTIGLSTGAIFTFPISPGIILENSAGDAALWLGNDNRVNAGLGILANNGSVIDLSGKYSSIDTYGSFTFGRIGAFKENNTSDDYSGYLSLYSRSSLQNLTEALRIDSSQRVGIGTTAPTSKLHVQGDVYITGVTTATDFNTTSDVNLKTNIHKIEDSLSKVIQIRGVTFNWKETNRSSAGVIAQEVENVLPEFVNGNEVKTVNYNGITGALIESIKELKAENDIMKQRLDEVYKKVFG